MIYAFDFDGVIADSAGGWAFFCREAWKKVCSGRAPPLKLIKSHRPYIRDARESYALLCLLSKNSKIDRVEVNKYKNKHSEEAKDFGNAFFDEKEIFIKNNNEKFCKDLYKPFKFIVPLLRNISAKENVYIVTSNKRSQVINILQKNKINIKESNILDSSVSKEKSDLIKIIQEREKAGASDILFIEDSIEHIKDVMPTGVQTALASWGFVLKEDIEEAKRLGVKVLDKKNISSILPEEEHFDVVDQNDKVIGRAARSECHEKGLLHRAVHIIILNSKGEMLLQKRSMKKDLYPGWWIDAAAGHVDSGENYNEAAKREMMEELGISIEIEEIFRISKRYVGDGCIDNELIDVYLGFSDGPFKFDKDEVDFVKFFQPKEVLNMMKKEKFTPASIVILEQLRKRPELLKRLELS